MLNEVLFCMQDKASMMPTKPADAQPASLWDSNLLEWCQQLKQHEADLVSNEDEGSIHESPGTKPAESIAKLRGAALTESELDSRQPEDADVNTAAGTASEAASGKRGNATEAATPSDPFAFDLGAFDMGGNAEAAEDPYAFDSSKFGQPNEGEKEEQSVGREKPKSQPEADPFAFDPSAFEISKPQSKSQAAADPFAFDPSAFEEATAPTEKAADDPFAFNMEAFRDDSEAQAAAPQQPSHQDADPFAFDMSAFGQPDQMQGVAEEAHGGKPKSQEQPYSVPNPAKGSATEIDPASEDKQKQQRSKSWKPHVFTKEPKQVFQALIASEVAALKKVLLPPIDAGSSEEQSSSDEAAEEGHKQEQRAPFVAGLSRESAEQVLKLAGVVASGLPDSIADASTLDKAAQSAGSSIQVGFVSSFETFESHQAVLSH